MAIYVNGVKVGGKIIGAIGPQGPQGFSAYEMAQQGGYKGTEEEFLYLLGHLNELTVAANLMAEAELVEATVSE